MTKVGWFRDGPIPLRFQGGVARSAGVVSKRSRSLLICPRSDPYFLLEITNHPVCAAKERGLFIRGAATPLWKGGEWSRNQPFPSAPDRNLWDSSDQFSIFIRKSNSFTRPMTAPISLIPGKTGAHRAPYKCFDSSLSAALVRASRRAAVVQPVSGIQQGIVQYADSLRNRLQEPSISFECGQVLQRKRLPDIILNFRRDDLHPADENTPYLTGRRLNRERQDGADRLFRKDVKQSRTFLEPRVAPGLDHRTSFP